MATFSDGKLSDPRRLAHLFKRLSPSYRDALRKRVRGVYETPINTTKPAPRPWRERIEDAYRWKRMLQPRDRDAFRERVRGVYETPVNTTKPAPRPRRERIDDADRGKRMLQLIASGALDYPAALQACIEDPGVATDDSCRRRLVRKYRDGKFTE